MDPIMRITRRQFTSAAASMMMLGTVGCASVSDKTGAKKPSLLDRMPWAADKDAPPEPYPNPVKMAATWTPDILVQTGRTPTRGFGGRIFFYDEKSRAVPVEGTLVVHGFNEQAASAKDTVKRFEFTPEQFTKHFSNCDLGASYSVWIPWDAAGGEQQRISLVASFKTSEGKPVQGVPATIMLPGTTQPSAPEDELARYSPKYREYKDALANNSRPTSGLTTTTIKRRQPRISETISPSIDIPSPVGNDSMIAKAPQTPWSEVLTLERPQSSTIRPVSGQLPIKR
jgi:hypothetical protein